MTITDPKFARDYECPTCYERSAAGALHADASRVWVDCICSNGHVWQVVTVPPAAPRSSAS